MIAAIAAHASTRAHREVSRRLNGTLRDSLDAHGWPSELARHVRMDASGALHIAQAGREEVMDLEYGTEDVPPSPALRRFQARMNVLADVYASQALDAVYSEVM